MVAKDKIAVVIGASSGIGLATAKLLTEKGSKLALIARSKDKLEKLSKELPGSTVIICDMSEPKQIISAFKKIIELFGRVDILVNNAGQGYDSPVAAIDVDIINKIFALDFVGPIVSMQQVIPLMKKQKGGSIINISSGTALMYLPNMGGYSSLKKALAHMSLTAREELKENNIFVSVVYPYITATDFEKNTIKSKTLKRELDGDIPFPADSPEHVAKKILQAITSGEAEVFAHDWMDPKNK